MAAYNTDVYAAQISPNVKDRVEGERVYGVIRFAEAVHTMTGTEAAAELVSIVKLPIGAIVYPELCKVATEACGGTGTAVSELGDAGSSTRYSSTSIALTSAAIIAVTAVPAITVSRFVITSATQVIIAKLGLSSGNTTAGKLVRFIIAFRLP